MIEINDDAAAADIYTKIDSTTGDERQQMADALITYGEKKAKEEYNQADEHFSNLFLDEKYYAEQVNTPDLQQAYEATPFPKEAAKRAVLQGYLQHASGAPVSADTYEFIRDSYAQAKFGKTTVSDDEMFGLVRGEYDWQKQRTEAINDLQMQAVGKAITDSQLGQNRPFVDGMTEVFNQWQQKYPELVDGKNDAAFLSQGYKLYYDTINDLDTVRPQASKALSTLTSFTQGNATDEDMQSLANDFVGAPPEDRQKIYKYVTLAAQAGQIDRAGIEQFAINMGQAFTRGFDFVPQGTLQMQEAGVNNWLESIRNGTQIWVPADGDLTKAVVGNAPAGAESDAWRQATVPEAETLIQSGQNVRESFKVVRELRNVAKTGVDPIRPVLEENSFWGTAERGAYGLAGSLPLMGVTAVNPYLGALAYQAQEYDRIMLENPDINPKFAQGLALVEGVANAATDRLEIANISGRLPMFGRWLDRVSSNGVRRTAKIAGSIAFENLQEAGQDLIAPILEAPISALRDDMPDQNFTKLMDDWSGQRAETFFATLPLALIGGGVATYQDIKNPSAELNATKLRMAGFGQDQVTFIQRAENPEEYDARIQMEWEKRTPENIKAGEQEVLNTIEKARTPGELDARMQRVTAPDGSEDIVVTSPDGKELLRTKSEQAALEAVRQHNEAQLINERNAVSDMVDYFRAQDPANVATIEAPRTVQQELDRLTEAGDSKGIANLNERIRFAGIPEGSDLTTYNILGEANVETTAEGVFRGVIKLRENSRPEDAFEEINHVFVRKALAEGRTDLDSLRGWLNQTSEATGETYATETETDIIENIAKVGMDYAAGRIEETSLPASFVDYIKRMLQVFKETMARAIKLKDAFATGKIDSNFESFLADSVGLNQQARVDTASNRVSKDIITDGGQMLMDFSIGSRTNAVSTDTPTIRASNATITGPANYSIAAHHGTPHKVDKFSTAKIGTGEGAQAYGWGLYFAENKGVAEQYQKNIKPEWQVTPTADGFRAMVLDANLKPKTAANFKTEAEATQWAENETGYKGGNLYTVELNAEPEDLLDWDKPLSEQGEKVRAAIHQWHFEKNLPVAEVSQLQSISEWVRWNYSDKQFSLELFAAGIPGIRYLDGGSRGSNSSVWKDGNQWAVTFADPSAGQSTTRRFPNEKEARAFDASLERTYNYVIFDENLIRITEENGNRIPASQALAAPATGATNYSIGIAPNGNTSNLKPEEQALAHSSEFKAWAGDWAALEYQNRIERFILDALDGKKDQEEIPLRKVTAQEVNEVMRQGGPNISGMEHVLDAAHIRHAFNSHSSKEEGDKKPGQRPLTRNDLMRIPEIINSYDSLRVKKAGTNRTSIIYGKSYQDGTINYIERVFETSRKNKPRLVTKTVWAVTEAGVKSNSSRVYTPDRTSNLPLENSRVNPESVTVKTDENGEPLASEIARFRKETGTSSFSIASQSEIDRVNKALGGMNRGPEGRLAIYERAKQKFAQVLQSNKESLDAIKSATPIDTTPAIEQVESERAARLADLTTEETSEVEKALQDNADTFMPRIEDAPTLAERKRVERDAKDRAKILEQGIRDKYAERKTAIETEANTKRQQIEQSAASRDSASRARMSEKVRRTKLLQAIGELDAILSVLPPEVRGRVGGFAVLANIGTGDKALGDFFVKRIDMIDRQLERTLKEEYGTAFDSLLERTKPKKAAAGEKPKGIGADIQSLFAVVREARNWSAEKVDGHIANLETQIASGNLTAEEEAMLTREADLVSLAGDWKNADSSRRAAALSAATETWAKGMSAFVQKKIREREDRDMARAEAISATGKKGDYVGRRKRSAADNGLRGKVHGWFMDTLAWDGVVNILFGHESPMAIRLSDGQRKAEYAKIDAVAAKEEAIHDLFTKLADGNRAAGEKLMWQMSQPSISANGLNLSELEALSATMLWMQEDGRRHMEGELNENGMPVGKWHYDQKFIDDIESALSPEAKAVRDYLLDAYGKEWFSINSVYREMNGINLPRIQNYSPVTVVPINAPAGMVTDPVTGNSVSATSISPGALRTRGTAIAEPAFRNVVQTYLAHTRQMEHWKAFAPWIKEANGILRFRDVQNSIKEAGGEEATGVLNRYLDAFSQGGNRDASLGLEISQVLNRMASRAAQVALIGRVGTLAIQTTQIGAASAELPMGAYVYRLGKLLTGNLGWGDSLNSAYIQRRLKQMPPIVQIAMEGLKAGKPNQLKHQVEKIGRLISGSDALWTAGTYAMVYDYNLSQAKTLGYTGKAAEDYAHNTAERITDRLAQPTRMGAKSIYEVTATNPGSRLGWAFASEARKNLALLAYTKANRPLKRFGATALGFIVFNLAMGAFIRNAWKDIRDDGDDEDEFFDAKTWNWKRIGVAMATEPLQGIPYLGDYTEKGINAALGQYHQSSDLISFERGVRAIKNIPDIVQGEREMADVLKDIDGMVSLMGLFNQNAAAAASLTHIASDFFGAVDNATED
jgi:hypothetical protein